MTATNAVCYHQSVSFRNMVIARPLTRMPAISKSALLTKNSEIIISHLPSFVIYGKYLFTRIRGEIEVRRWWQSLLRGNFILGDLDGVARDRYLSINPFSNAPPPFYGLDGPLCFNPSGKRKLCQ